MNKGISLAKGEWLYFLGTDDILFNKDTLATIFSKSISNQPKLIIGNIKYNLRNNNSIFIKKKNNGVVKPSWSKKLWIKNTLHHQGIFYRKELFTNRNYSLKYKILADYDFNLQLYKNKIKVTVIDEIIAICGSEGLSKKYNWSLYKEEIALKTLKSSFLFKPLFFLNSFAKYLSKKIL